MYDIIHYLFPGIQDWQFSLQDDGNGPYITYWDYPETQPTQQEMDAVADEVVFIMMARNLAIGADSVLTAGAVQAGYPSIERACMYAAAVNTYQAESLSFLAWAVAVREYRIAQIASMKDETRSIPTIEEFNLELPARVLPT